MGHPSDLANTRSLDSARDDGSLNQPRIASLTGIRSVGILGWVGARWFAASDAGSKYAGDLQPGRAFPL